RSPRSAGTKPGASCSGPWGVGRRGKRRDRSSTSTSTRRAFARVIATTDRLRPGAFDCRICGRRTQNRESRGVLRAADGGAEGGAAGGRHGHVGAVHRRDARGPAGGRDEDRLRPVSHHARDDEGRRYGPEAGTPRVPGAGEDSPLTGTKYVWRYSDER